MNNLIHKLFALAGLCDWPDQQTPSHDQMAATEWERFMWRDYHQPEDTELTDDEMSAAIRRKGDFVGDGYAYISAWCPECGNKTMQVVRPGKFQCSKCGQEQR